MADVTTPAGVDVVRDPTAYARRQTLEVLPPHAQVKYNQYVERKREAETLTSYYRERSDELGQKLYVLQHNLSAAKQNDGAISYYERQTSAAQAEYDALAAKRSSTDTRRIIFTNIVQQLDNYLNAKSNGMWRGPHHEDAEPPVAKLRKGESYADAIRRCQDEASALDLQLVTLRNAPPPPDEVREMIVSQLASLRSSSGFGHRFVTDGLGNEKLELIAPDLMMWSDASNVRGLLTTYMLHLFPEKMFELFTAGIDDNAVGIARAHKPQLVNELECRIIEAELEEMSLIEQAQQQGLDVVPRASMSPLALLGLCPVRRSPPELMQAAE